MKWNLVAIILLLFFTILVILLPSYNEQESYKIGDSLVNKYSGAVIGTILDIDDDHLFPNGGIERGYLIERTEGDYPMRPRWMVARVIDRISQNN